MAIVSCLVDTNILLRMTRRADPQHEMVDAALARLAFVHRVSHILTLNESDFTRYGGIVVVHPNGV